MGKVIAGMTVSLDGFVHDRQGEVGALYPDFETFQQSEVLQESIRTTGAVIMGRRAFAMGDADWYADNYEYQVPIFVLTHAAPPNHPRETEKLSFTFVTDGIESAIRQAKIAAGNQDVTIIGGASVIQQALTSGLVDELHLDLMPVLLGSGLRLFDQPGNNQIKLERQRVVELPSGRTHLQFRLMK